MNQDLKTALLLRKEGNYEESNAILKKLALEHPKDPVIQYQCAWSYDVRGMEAEAVPFYESAISLGLSGSDLEGAFLGLGSTYRTLGEYEKSVETLTKGVKMFPDNHALQVFYAMALYNVKEHNKAMEILLKNIANTTSDATILSYKKAIMFYSDKLDEVWK